MKTRSKRIQDEQEGVLPSPPRALIDEPRPRRPRVPKAATRSQSQASSSTEPSASAPGGSQFQPATQPSTSGRIKKPTAKRGQGRGRTPASRSQQDHTDSLAASASAEAESSAQAFDASTLQADTSTQQKDNIFQADGNTVRQSVEDNDGDNGETRISHTGSAAHPVSAGYGPPNGPPNDAPSMHAQPVLGWNAEASAFKAATHPVSAGPLVSKSPEIRIRATPPSKLAAQSAASQSPVTQQDSASSMPPGRGIPGLFPNSTAFYNAASEPVPAAYGTQSLQAQPVQEKRSPSETSLLFAGIVSPRNTTGTPTQRTPDNLFPGYDPSVTPPTFERAFATPNLDKTPVARLKGSVGGLTPMFNTPPPPSPVMPHVYNLPPNPEKPHSLFHIFVDSVPAKGFGSPALATLGKAIAFTIPSEQIVPHLMLAAHENPQLQAMLNDSIAEPLVEKYKLTSRKMIEFKSIDNPLRTKRKRDDRHTHDETHEDSPRSRTSKSGKTPRPRYGPMRLAFQRVAAETKRAALEESNAQAKARENGSPSKRIRTETRTVPDLYDENGRLTLGNWKQVTVEVDDTGSPIRKSGLSTSFTENEPPVDQNHRETPYVAEEISEDSGQPMQGLFTEQHGQQDEQHAPETPQSRGWGFSSFLPSAQTVSKFIPFTSRRTPSAAAAQPRDPDPVDNQSRFSPSVSTPQRSASQRRAAQSEPRQQIHEDDVRMSDAAPNTTVGPVRRRQQSSKKQLLTKKQAEERQRLKKEKEELRAEKERLEEERLRMAQEKKEWEEQRAKIEAAQAPGTKRKRVPSPDVIPLPPGGGFGLHPDYFYFSSDEEDFADEDDTPTKQPAAKKARISSSGSEVVGDPKMATPYTGTMFAVPVPAPTPATTGNNVFAKDTNVDSTNGSKSSPYQPNTFTVPDDEDSELSDLASPEQTSFNVQPSLATPQSPAPLSKSMAAPPPPNPSHATLPTPHIMMGDEGYIDPVEKARQKALKHQPKTGSRLRESSHLSPVNTAISQENKQAEPILEQAADDASNTGAEPETPEHEYDPRRPTLLPSFPPSGPSSSEFNSQPFAGASIDYSKIVEHTNSTDQAIPTMDDGMEWAFDAYQTQMHPRVRALLGNNWDLIGDASASETNFDAQFQDYQQEMDARDTIPEFPALEKHEMTPKVQKHLEEQWTEEDDDMAEDYFNEFYNTFTGRNTKGNNLVTAA